MGGSRHVHPWQRGDDSFELVNGVTIYGGFDGTETSPGQRDPVANETILSGEIGAAGTSDNAYHVLIGSGTDSTAVLDGFTVTAGNANDGTFPDNYGGGMLNELGSPSLMDVTFDVNAALDGGGGMYNYNSSPSLTNVTFSNNGSPDGGGMTNTNNSTPNLAGVTFSGNSASYGGGMSNNFSSPILTNVTFSGNSAAHGGGMSNNSSSPILTNASFSTNTAVTSGGGMYNYTSSPVIRDSIFWGNGTEFDGATTTTINDSLIQGGCPAGATCGGLFLMSDPLLGALADNGGLTQTRALGAGSPAINAGNNTTCAHTDQRGIARPQGAACDMGSYELELIPVLYVTPGGLTSGACESWAHACELRYALPIAVSGQQIWAAAGTYTPGATRSATFTLNNGVALYGGFTGTETQLSQRNPTTHVTTLSGEIGAAGTSDNSYHVVTGGETAGAPDPFTVLDGFTVTAGNANGGTDSDASGGGMFNEFSSPTLTDVNFTGNSAVNYGGGMLNDTSSPALTNVTFHNNVAGASGGGIFNAHGNARLTNITFSANSAHSGGGMYNYESDSILTNATFSGNSADWGGAMYSEYSAPSLTNVTSSGNTAAEGAGAMFIDNSDPVIKNSIFWGNGTEFDGLVSTPVIEDSVIPGGCPTGATCSGTIPQRQSAVGRTGRQRRLDADHGARRRQPSH